MTAIQWFVPPALAAIARNVKSSTRTFCAAQLSAWASDERLHFPIGIAQAALTRLYQQGYTGTRPHVNRRGSTRLWYVTPEGLQAAQAALMSMPGTPGPDVRTLPVRVWNLLRIRRRLTAVEAAQTLIDAEDDFATQTRRISALLAAWARWAPTVVAVGRVREAGGRVRYVLLNDLGPWPAPSRAGQVHPSRFADVQAIPARYLKQCDAADAGAAQ